MSLGGDKRQNFQLQLDLTNRPSGEAARPERRPKRARRRTPTKAQLEPNGSWRRYLGPAEAPGGPVATVENTTPPDSRAGDQGRSAPNGQATAGSVRGPWRLARGKALS